MIIGISDQMGAQFDRLRCEVCQNLILSPINTGLLRYAVATVLTVYGIETYRNSKSKYHFLFSCNSTYRLRYWNPVTLAPTTSSMQSVATVLTVYGIETSSCRMVKFHNNQLQQCLPFTVLKLSTYYCSIITIYSWLQQCLPFTVLKRMFPCIVNQIFFQVATVLTVYGIETSNVFTTGWTISSLQQYLPFTVLKHTIIDSHIYFTIIVATVLTVCGIETNKNNASISKNSKGCNSAYRLRYWNVGLCLIWALFPLLLQQRLPFTVLKQHKTKRVIPHWMHKL